MMKLVQEIVLHKCYKGPKLGERLKSLLLTLSVNDLTLQADKFLKWLEDEKERNRFNSVSKSNANGKHSTCWQNNEEEKDWRMVRQRKVQQRSKIVQMEGALC